MPSAQNFSKPKQDHIVAAEKRTPQPRISSLALLGPRGDLIIEHDGREYRLRLTQNGKLILTA